MFLVFVQWFSSFFFVCVHRHPVIIPIIILHSTPRLSGGHPLAWLKRATAVHKLVARERTGCLVGVERSNAVPGVWYSTRVRNRLRAGGVFTFFFWSWAFGVVHHHRPAWGQ